MRRLFSILLALVLLCSLFCVPAQASGEASGEASGGASGNPYADMSVEITGPYEIEETEVETQRGDIILRGILTVPVTDAEKLPVAVLTHGFNANLADMEQIAEALGKNGIASVRFNLTSYGNSDGEYVDVTFTTEKEDVLAALDFAKSLDFADTDNLFLIGKSQGGFDSALASIDCEDEINALILWYPAICIPDDFKNGRVQFVSFDPENIPETLDFMGIFEVSRAFIEEGMSIDPLKDFTVFQKDVLIIHGTSDFIVDYDYAVELADAYPSAELITIEGGGHGFSGDGLMTALDATVTFVQEHLVGDNSDETSGEASSEASVEASGEASGSASGEASGSGEIDFEALLAILFGGSTGPTAEEVIGDADVVSIEIDLPEDFAVWSYMDMRSIPETVTAELSDGRKEDVAQLVTYTGDLSQGGEVEVTASLTYNGKTVTDSVVLNVRKSMFVSDEVPDQYRGEVEEKGSIEHLTYTTYVYEEDGTVGESAENECYVYLPYGYSEDGEYNVLYLMHGGGESAGYWLAQGPYAEQEPMFGMANFTVEMLDNLIAQEYCDPVIVVTPCIASSIDAGVNSPYSFQYELKNELIPLIESAYATYAHGDTDSDSLTASRDHRAFAGLSMGSITSWSSILKGCTDWIGYVGAFSGCKSDIPAIADELNTTYAECPILYFYNGNGTSDMSHDEHVEAYDEILELCPDRFQEGEDYLSGDNCTFVDKPGMMHAYESWIVDLYNVLGVFFECAD